MVAQVFAHILLHAVDLGEKAGGGGVVVVGMGFGGAQVGHLRLKAGDPFRGDFQFLIVGILAAPIRSPQFPACRHRVRFASAKWRLLPARYRDMRQRQKYLPLSRIRPHHWDRARVGARQGGASAGLIAGA